MTEDQAAIVAALLAERGEADANGQPGRVKAIDEQLRLRGHGPDGKPLRAGPSRGRRRPPKEAT